MGSRSKLTCQISTPRFVASATWDLTQSCRVLRSTWKPGFVVQEADEQDRAFVFGEAAAEFADVPDHPVGGLQWGLRPGPDVIAEGDLEVLQRCLDLDVGVVVGQEVQP